MNGVNEIVAYPSPAVALTAAGGDGGPAGVTGAEASDAILDRRGEARVIYSTPNWEDYVHVSCVEIRGCGAGNVQVARRLRAMLDNLVATLPARRRPALDEERRRLDLAIAPQYSIPGDLELARVPDSQGLGGSSRVSARR